MVNLRARANVLTRRINPNISIGLRRYTGMTVSDDGSQNPAYAKAVPILGQVQAIGKKDVEHLASLNISDCERMVYADTQLQATDRRDQTSGDLLIFEDRVWLVVAIMEGWSTAGWCRAAVSKQMDAPC